MATPKKLSKAEAGQRQAAVDELGRLNAETALLKLKEKRAEYLRVVIESWYPDLDPASNAVAEGRKYFALLSQRGSKREVISIDAIRERLGDVVFMEACSIALGKLDVLLKIEELPKYVSSARTGNRSIETAPRAGKAA